MIVFEVTIFRPGEWRVGEESRARTNFLPRLLVAHGIITSSPPVIMKDQLSDLDNDGKSSIIEIFMFLMFTD